MFRVLIFLIGLIFLIAVKAPAQTSDEGAAGTATAQASEDGTAADENEEEEDDDDEPDCD